MRNDSKFEVLHPPCFYCKHIINIGGLDLKGWTCKAFPQGIPQEILSRKESHTETWGIDRGYVYESEPHMGEQITFDGDWIKAKE